MSDKYISMHQKLSGFSFANLGIFTGLASGIIGAVYSLVLLDILKNPALVGVYVSAYFAFAMAISLFAGEIFKRISKARLFYICLLAAAIIYAMMGFSIRPATFITLDFTGGIFQVLIGLLIPLFMADFSREVGMEKLNARYWFWINVGALIAPLLSLTVADYFGIRAPFFVVAVIYAIGLLVFSSMRIIQEDKKAAVIQARRTLRYLWRAVLVFFRRKSFARAYAVLFGNYAMVALRGIYVPIIVMENGFSKETLGLVLTLGIIPYVILSQPMGWLAKKYGKKLWLSIGFFSFAALAFWASVASGWTVLLIFVLWQIPGAFIEPLRDLLFFDAAKKEERARFMGIFRTASAIARIVIPMVAAIVIFAFGATSSVWIVAGIMAAATGLLLLKK
ncbi:MAG: MFS transporter [Alphaproteobacteria bacterium]|nr:MFS transporter [Alphaproteobacteria bacterium]MCL2757787.1 MFS transporter [Alphaproteobacteria bacterium]